MALSGSRDFLLTRDDVIELALSKIGALEQGQSPTSDQLARSAKSLNTIVKSLQTESVYLWEATTGSTTVVVGQTTVYALGVDVIAIEHPLIRRSGEDIPLTVITREEWMTIIDKDASGKPSKIFPELTLTGLQYTLWPVGETGQSDTIYYTQYKKLQDFDAASNDLPFPSFWSQALVYLLAFDQSHDYSLPVSERNELFSFANILKTEAKGASREGGSLMFRGGGK